MQTTIYPYRYRPFLVAFFALLVLASLACNLFGSRVPPQPEVVITVSTQAAGEFEQRLLDASNQAAASGAVNLQLTEAQVTSYLALRLLEFQQQGDLQEYVVSNPQVYLRDGKVQIYADVQQNRLQLGLYVAIIPEITPGQQPRLILESVYLGQVAAPDALVRQIQNGLDEAYANLVRSAGQNFTVETITIADGLLTIQGRIQQP